MPQPHGRKRETEMKISQVLVAAFIPFCVWAYIDNNHQEAKQAAVEAAKSPEQKALERRQASLKGLGFAQGHLMLAIDTVTWACYDVTADGQVNMLDARKRHTEECLEAKDQEKYEGDKMQKIKDSFKPPITDDELSKSADAGHDYADGFITWRRPYAR
jgi:hypothetical protein